MSLQDDIFDLQDALKLIPGKVHRREARRCLKKVLERLNHAERCEIKYIQIMQAFSTLRYVLAMKEQS